VVERLCEESVAAAADHAPEALRLARLALRAAELASGADGFEADTVPFCEAEPVPPGGDAHPPLAREGERDPLDAPLFPIDPVERAPLARDPSSKQGVERSGRPAAGRARGASRALARR
jgi:hypothetical protein